MPIDFSFLTKDVQRQRELAQTALDEAKRIDELLQNSNVENRQALEDAKRKWLEMARSLAENSTTTSASGAATIFSVTKGLV